MITIVPSGRNPRISYSRLLVLILENAKATICTTKVYTTRSWSRIRKDDFIANCVTVHEANIIILINCILLHDPPRSWFQIERDASEFQNINKRHLHCSTMLRTMHIVRSKLLLASTVGCLTKSLLFINYVAMRRAPH